MTEEKITEIIETLTQIEGDAEVPKNVKSKIKNALISLKENEPNVPVKVDRTLQELDDISEDPNLPTYTRMQIWNIVSLLESL